MRKKVDLIFVFLLLFLLLDVAVGSDYTASFGINIFTSTDFKITGVTCLGKGKVSFCGRNGTSGRGEIHEISYNTSGMTGSFKTSFDVSVVPDSIAYMGLASGGDQYYLGRYYSSKGHIEQWNSVTGWGSEKADYSSYVLGLGNTVNIADEVIEGLNKTGYLHPLSIGQTLVTSSSISYFHGATSLGDINGDGDEDYLFCSGPGPVGNEASFDSFLWYMESNGSGGWNTDFLGLTDAATTFSGVANLGDIDNDGYIELMLTRFQRSNMDNSWMDIVETDIPVPIPDVGKSTDFETCPEVRLYGYTITGDINNDCSVGLPDLEYITNQWLAENVPQHLSAVDNFNRTDTSMTTGNSKDVWFASDVGNGWQEYCQGNGVVGADANAPDAWLESQRAELFRVGNGSNAACYIKNSIGSCIGVQADLEIVPWRDSGTYYQDNSYVGLFMEDSATGAYAYLRVRPAGSIGNRYLELNYSHSDDGSWNGWLLFTPRNVGSAEYGSEIGEITCSMEIYDNGGGDLGINITAKKGVTELTNFDLDWFDDITSFDTVQVIGKWNDSSETSGAGAYMYADNVDAVIPAQSIDPKPDVCIDGKIDFCDFAKLAQDWMRCNDPNGTNCEDSVAPDSPFDFGTTIPIYNVIGFDPNQQHILVDGNTASGLSISAGGSFTIQRNSPNEVIWLAMHISASSNGNFTVQSSDVMPVEAFYNANQGWYRHRLPYSTAGDIVVKWGSSAAVINEIVLLGRSALLSSAEAGIEYDSVSVNLSGVSTTPESDIPFGVVSAFDQRGVSEGMTVAATRTELIQKLNDLGVTSLRFPGGGITYSYPMDSNAFTAYASDPDIYRWNYHLIDQDYWGWVSAEDYLDFCKDANLIAWYQIDPAFYYDQAASEARQIRSMDSTAGAISGIPDSYTGDYLTEAVAEMVNFAQKAQDKGVEVVWEIGNEDYNKFLPTTYAAICKAFIDGIWTVDPTAKVAICADSYSWGDWTFPNQVVAELASLGLSRIDYASNHLYLNGNVLYDNPDIMGAYIIDRWDSLKSMFNNQLSSNFHNQGYTETRIAYTEFNALMNSAEGQYKAAGAEIDHSVGRALADAFILPNVYQQGVGAVFMHDLVRNGPDSIYFARLDYYPDNPAGRRYFSYPELEATSIVAEHGHGNICYGSTSYDNGIYISRHEGFVYITVVNRTNKYKDIDITLNGITIDTGSAMDLKMFRAGSSICSVFDYYTSQQQLSAPQSGNTVSVEVPCYSVIGLKVYINN